MANCALDRTLGLLAYGHGTRGAILCVRPGAKGACSLQSGPPGVAQVRTDAVSHGDGSYHLAPGIPTFAPDWAILSQESRGSFRPVHREG